MKCGFVEGNQRYKCRRCGGFQFTNTKRRNVDPPLKSLVIVLYAFCGVPLEKIERLFNGSLVAFLINKKLGNPPLQLDWLIVP